MSELRVARMGNGVTDLDAVSDFYARLGFDVGMEMALGDALSAQSELLPAPLTIRVVRRDGFDLELVQHGDRRPPSRPPVRRPLNQPGLAYLALAVDDVDRVASSIAGTGGTRYDFTRSATLGVDAMFCADPCGLRLLLLQGGACGLGSYTPGDDGIGVAFVGVTVSNLERSVAFYCAVGFDREGGGELGAEISTITELDDVPLQVATVEQGPYRVVLHQWGTPHDAGVPVRLPLNRTGEPIHFGTHTDDFDAALSRVVAHGGTVIERTRSVFPPPGITIASMPEPHGWIFVLDPDGVEIEVVGPRLRHRARQEAT